MNRKRPCYEDYFRISDPNPASNENAPDLDLEKAATLLCEASCALAGSMWRGRGGARQGNSLNRQMRMPEMGWPGMQQRHNPNFNDGRPPMTEMVTEPERFRPLPPHDSLDMPGISGGPERFRPLCTSESYNEESNWNLGQPDSRGQDFGGDAFYTDEYLQNNEYFQGGEGNFVNQRNTHQSQYERPYHNFDRPSQGPTPFQRPPVSVNDRQSVNDRKPHCDSQFQDRQPYDERPRQARGAFAQNSNAADQCGSKPEQFSSTARGQEDSGGTSSTPAPTKDQESDKEETDDDSDEDTSFCKLCNVPFENAQKYFMHTRGLLHTQRQMGAKQELANEQGQDQQEDGKQQPQQGDGQKQQQADSLQPQQAGTSIPPETNTGAAEVSRGQEQDDEYWEEEWEEEETESNEFTCELCDVRTTGQKALITHENGRFHKAVTEAIENNTPLSQRMYNKLGPKAKIPLELKPATAAVLEMKPFSGPSVLLELLEKVPVAVVGTALIKEGRSKKQPSFFCTICESMCDASGILSHIIGSRHRMKYLRAYHPTIYEHVRSHGGKKSQLSVFLEEVCTDIEKKEGRTEPMLEKPDNSTEDEKPAEKNESAKEEKEENKDPMQTAKGNKGAEESQWRRRRNLPHDVVMAMYKENKTKSETEGPRAFGFGDRGFPQGPELAPPWHNPDRGPEFAPPWHNPDRGPYHNPDRGPYRNPDRGPYRNPDRGPYRNPDRGPYRNPEGDPFHNPGRGPYLDMPRPPDPYRPPVMNFPDPFMSEEERLKCMYGYEAYLFDHPMLLVSPEEARCRMFNEYERIGIPYDIACDRVLVQEERRTRIMNLMRDGRSLKEAQIMLRKTESRKQLIQEYEQQGLNPREARWRAITEEEREKLYEKYENLGFTAMEARAKIMAGEDRMHLVQEFERHGMTPEEALRRAIAEEDRLKVLLAPSKTEQNLDDAADRRMLMTYLEQGDSRETAENKTIAVLRRQGVPTQEAILRVQKIIVKVPEKSHKVEPHRTHDEDRKDRDQERQHGSKPTENFDNISPEEAKERLFQEYEKRGVPREKARIALIQELIRSGVPEEEAKRRFSDLRPTEAVKREGKGSKKKHSRGKRSRSRSRSSSASRSSRKRRHSPLIERKKYPRSYQDERDRTDFRNDRHRLPEERRREEKDRDRRFKDSRERERSREQPSRPTLTLGEELKLKAKKLKRAEILSRLEDGSSPSAIPGTSSQHPAEKSLPDSKKDDKSVSELLESLADNLISSKDNESEALSMSKVLTSALLKYRLNALTGDQEKPSTSATNTSFVERRIQDAKKLFETKMQPRKESPGPSGLTMTVDRGDRRVVWTGPESDSANVDPRTFGLPPPTSNSYKSQQPSHSGDLSSKSRFQTRASPERKPIVPRVLLGSNTSTKGSSSSSRYRH